MVSFFIYLFVQSQVLWRKKKERLKKVLFEVVWKKTIEKVDKRQRGFCEKFNKRLDVKVVNKQELNIQSKNVS